MNPNRLRLTTKQLSSTTITLAMTILILVIMNQIQPNYAGPLAEMQAFRLGQSLTRQPITIWRRVFYPFPVNVVEKKYVPVKIPIPVYVKPPPPPPSYQPSYLSYATYPYYNSKTYSSQLNQQQQQQQYPHQDQQYQSSNQSPRYYYQTPILTATNNYQSYY